MKRLLFQKITCLLVLLVLCSWQPFSFLDDLQSKFDQYIKANPSVKINLVFNQPYYAPGDTAFFSAWYTDDSFQPIKGTHIVTADLFSGTGKVHQRIKFKVQNGRSYNQIALRRDLQPGDFKLIVYTDWMKSLPTPQYFEKTLQVESRKEIHSEAKDKNDIHSYAEGGHFIAGIANKLTLLGEAGKKVQIRDNQNNEIASITLDSTGLGTTQITPASEGKYTAQYTADKAFELPSVEKNGIALRFDSKEDALIHLTKSQGSDLPAQLFAVIVSKGKITFKKEIEWSAENAVSIIVPSETLELNQFYVLDAKGKLYAERLFVIGKKQSSIVKFDFPEEVGQREKVTGKIAIQSETASTIESDLTVSVFQEHLFKDSKMSAYSFLNIPGLYERELKFGDRAIANANDFLITENDTRLDWNAVLNAKPLGKTMPLNDQVKLTGQVISKKNGQPAPDSTDVIVYLQKNTIGYEDYTKDGKFEIPFIFDFSGDEQVFHSLHYKSKIMDAEYDLIVDQDSLKINETWESSETGTPAIYGEYAFNKNLIAKSYSFFTEKKSSVIEDQNLNRIFEDEFLGADYSVRISDYLVFPTIEDIFNEIVPFVQYKKKGDKGTLRISYRSETSTRTYKEAPLLIIDGVMTKDLQSLLTLKPEKIVVIKVLNNPNKLTQVGKLGENGILFVETKNGGLAKTLSEENLFPITGLSKAVAPSNSGEQSKLVRIPSLRANLYWNPAMKTNSSTNSEISFYTGDDTGPMIIQVEGITKDGQHFIARHKMVVNFKSPNK